MRTAKAAGRRQWSKKTLVVTTALGVVALGTGVGFAATQSSASSVRCILVADATAAADANTALSDVFAVGTKLHFVSAGRTVDVTVSGPITAAAPPSADPSASASADPSASATAGGGHKKRHHGRGGKKRAEPKGNAAKGSANTKAADTTNAVNALKAKDVAKAAKGDNDGVDPNTVCAELSKNAFNTLGNVANGNNVGAFIATMTPVADDSAASPSAKQ
jgi:hypothetical protein